MISGHNKFWYGILKSWNACWKQLSKYDNKKIINKKVFPNL